MPRLHSANDPYRQVMNRLGHARSSLPTFADSSLAIPFLLPLLCTSQLLTVLSKHPSPPFDRSDLTCQTIPCIPHPLGKQ